MHRYTLNIMWNHVVYGYVNIMHIILTASIFGAMTPCPKKKLKRTKVDFFRPALALSPAAQKRATHRGATRDAARWHIGAHDEWRGLLQLSHWCRGHRSLEDWVSRPKTQWEFFAVVLGMLCLFCFWGNCSDVLRLYFSSVYGLSLLHAENS